MPVLLKKGSGEDPNPEVIDLDDYATGRHNFRNHYYMEGCNDVFFGQDITIPWTSLQNAVNSFCAQNQVNPSVVAIRFVYCFDVGTNSLYLRAQILTMGQPTQNSNVYPLIATPCAWYQITASGMAPTQNTSLEDPVYLSNLYYCDYGFECNEAELQQLGSDDGLIYARTVTFPWQNEIKKMYVDNGSPQGASICFGACSYVKKSDGSDLTIWPHGLVLYLKNAQGDPMLNDNTYIVLFANKGCDMGTLCPPECNVYISPLLL